MSASGQPVPAVQTFGCALVLTGLAVLDVRALVALGVRQAARDGVTAPPRLAQLQRALDTVAAEVRVKSLPGHHDATLRLCQPDSTRSDRLGTQEVAEMLGLTQRQVQRLAPQLGAEQLANRTYLFDRVAVEAHAAARHPHRDGDHR